MKQFNKKCAKFKKGPQFAPTFPIPSKWFFSGDITNLNKSYLFGHVARASPEDNRLRNLRAAMRKPVAGWNISKGRLRTTGIRRVKNDLSALNIGIHSVLRKA